MKIICLGNYRLPTEKAHGYQIAKMCEEFFLARVDISLWFPSRKNEIKENIFDYYKIKNIFKVKVIKSFDFLIFVKKLGALSFYLQGLFFYSKLFFLKIDKDAIIYTRNPEIVWILKLRGYQVAYECHDWFGQKKKIALFLLKNCDYIITTNNFIKKQFILNGLKKNILVAPNGVDLKIFDLDISKQEAITNLNVLNDDIKSKIKNKKILLYTGSYKTMGVDKGINDILKALKKIDDKKLFFLAVGGSEKDIAYYHSIAKNLGIVDQVLFFTRVNQKRLALFQKLADVMLMPFPDKAHYKYFMTPLKMFEYMCSDRPIIASSLPSIKEILNEKNCLFCKPDDVDDLKNKIEFVFDVNNKDKVNLLTKRALNDVEKYVWSNRAKRILEFFGDSPF